jgi:hypothetical protein
MALRLLLSALLVVLTAALAPTASAKVVELGAGSTEAAASKCPGTQPGDCQAVYQVTGYQGRSASLKSPFQVSRSGYIVAFTLQLPQLTQEQIDFFTRNLGGEPKVRLAVLRKGTKRKTRLNHRLVRQSQVFSVSKYIGSSPTFVLDQPLRIGKDNLLGLTIPTWLPALAFDLSAGNWWRSSRPKGKCGGGEGDSLSPPSAQQELGEIVRYGCTYKNARLLFTATYVPDPEPTVQASR